MCYSFYFVSFSFTFLLLLHIDIIYLKVMMCLTERWTHHLHISYIVKLWSFFLYLFSLLRSAVCKNHKQPQCIEKCVRNESLKAKRNQDATLCVQDSFLFQYHMVFSSLYCSAALILDTRNSYFQRRHTLSIKGWN